MSAKYATPKEVVDYYKNAPPTEATAILQMLPLQRAEYVYQKIYQQVEVIIKVVMA